MPSRFLCFLVLLAIAGRSAAAPTLIGHARDGRCADALQMAQDAFRSDSPSLIWPIAKPVRPTTQIILAQASEDISGGDGIAAKDDFERQSGDHARAIFWRVGGQNRPRLAVIDTPFNWQGDWYSVYLLPADATPDGLQTALTADGPGSKPNALLGDARWAIPLVLTNRKTGQDWIIDRGEPFALLADWRVFEPVGYGLKLLCRVSFGLPNDGGLPLLPRAVKRFAAEMNEALGPGNDEGTLHQTAAIRLAVKRQWANAALRPWAASAKAYNSRDEIKRGLEKWEQGNRKRLALHDRMRRDEFPAVQALASFYVSHFGMSPGRAQQLSQSVLDRALKTSFVFSKSGL